MKIKRTREMPLRMLALAALLAIALALIIVASVVNQRMGYQTKHVAIGGRLALSEQEVNGQPVHLDGAWDAFDGLVYTRQQEIAPLGEAAGQMKFPIGSRVDASKNASYRLRFLLPEGTQEELLLYIPNFNKGADVYLNGSLQPYLQDGASWLKHAAGESMVPLRNLLPDGQWQELVISAPFSEQETSLYKRQVTMGTMKNLVALSNFSSANEMFLFGLLLLILINGYIFMLFRPGHKVISLMTLFDTFVLLRTALAMEYVVSFLKDIFPWLPSSDFINASVTLFFLLLGGIVGCKLSAALYDPQGKVPAWLIKPMPCLYLIFALTLPWNPAFFESVGKYMLFAVYGITFVGVFWQYTISWADRKRRVYNLLQFIKTVYIGALVLLDILTWDIASNYLLLFYLYSGFFILHVAVRLYDNNESYRDVEMLNAGLEDTVKQRTQELSEANRILAEIAIRDPLTQTFNRLHFEREMEKATMAFAPGGSLHLCIFDLDLFKRINDTYGHHTGDEQLRRLVELVGNIVEDKAVFARFGGEEFVLLFPGLSRDEVLACTETVRAAIEADAAANIKNTTASFGLAAFGEGDTAKQMMKRADKALYEAKRLGRNRIVTDFSEVALVENT